MAVPGTMLGPGAGMGPAGSAAVSSQGLQARQ